jgi:hypothetical protein
MNKEDWKLAIVYVIVNNWGWLKYVVATGMILLILRALRIV